jgi:hypothetical protein
MPRPSACQREALAVAALANVIAPPPGSTDFGLSGGTHRVVRSRAPVMFHLPPGTRQETTLGASGPYFWSLSRRAAIAVTQAADAIP